MVDHHPDDEFHPADPADPFWTETCWFTFTVPERRLSGQFYPFFRTTQGVLSAGAFFWDRSGQTPASALHARQFWHLPIPDEPLTDIQLPNGISYRCVEPLHTYELSYRDPDVGPDGGDPVISVDLTFTAMARPNYLGESHLDQPGRYRGTITLAGEEMAVDSFGFRDRSWGPRSQFGYGIHGTGARCGGYSYATASEADAFHAITMDFGSGDFGSGDFGGGDFSGGDVSGSGDGSGSGSMAIHGYVLRDGEWSKVASGRRTVLERDPGTAYPTAVALDLVDERGRSLHAEGRCLNGLGLFLNPNLYSVNCLTEWTFDGLTAYGEDHDNWSATGIQGFLRSRAAGTHPT